MSPQGDILNWPRGQMDKASAYGAGDCRLEFCRGHGWDPRSLVRSQVTPPSFTPKHGLFQPLRGVDCRGQGLEQPRARMMWDRNQRSPPPQTLYEAQRQVSVFATGNR